MEKRKAMVNWEYISAQKSVLEFLFDFHIIDFHTGPYKGLNLTFKVNIQFEKSSESIRILIYSKYVPEKRFLFYIFQFYNKFNF